MYVHTYIYAHTLTHSAHTPYRNKVQERGGQEARAWLLKVTVLLILKRYFTTTLPLLYFYFTTALLAYYCFASLPCPPFGAAAGDGPSGIEIVCVCVERESARAWCVCIERVRVRGACGY